MNENLQKIIVLDNDYNNVKPLPITREDCLSNITKSLQQIADGCFDAKQQQQ